MGRPVRGDTRPHDLVQVPDTLATVDGARQHDEETEEWSKARLGAVFVHTNDVRTRLNQ